VGDISPWAGNIRTYNSLLEKAYSIANNDFFVIIWKSNAFGANIDLSMGYTKPKIMKRNILLLAAAVCLVTTISSCTRCETCTETNGTSDKYCSSNSTDRNNYAKAQTLAGATCNESTSL